MRLHENFLFFLKNAKCNISILFILQLPTQFYMALVRHYTKFLLHYFDSCSVMIELSFCNAAIYHDNSDSYWTDAIL
jgi:hypothetical protein